MIARRGLRISVRLRRERGGQRSPSKGSWSVRYLEEDFMRERSKESSEQEGLTRIVRLQLQERVLYGAEIGSARAVPRARSSGSNQGLMRARVS